MVKETKIRRWVLWKVFLRMGLLQASWNFQRLQNLGVLYCLGPVLRRIYGGDELKQAQLRHLEYFNTHPFFAPAVLGAAAAMEEDRAGGLPPVIATEEFKRMTMAPFAAIGDALFWGALRPLGSCVALFFAFKGSFWAPVVFLLIFNVPHFFFVFTGFWLGYGRRHQILELVAKKRLPDVAVRAKEMMVILLAVLCALLVFLQVEKGQGSVLQMVFGLAFIYGVSWLFRRGASALILVLGGSGICLFYGFLSKVVFSW